MHANAAIRVENLRLSYPGVEVLHGLTFTVNRGEVTGLIGPNGAGKSTTRRILTGMLEPSDGSVGVEGCMLPRQAFELKQRIGYVPEAAELYETLSAQEFLELCGRLHEIEEPALQTRIASLLTGFDLEDERNQRLGTYSKGMRQKVLIAAALVRRPCSREFTKGRSHHDVVDQLETVAIELSRPVIERIAIATPRSHANTRRIAPGIDLSLHTI